MLHLHLGAAALKWTIAAMLAGNAADSASSWQRPEMNPVLGQQFTGQSMAIKMGVVGAVALSELSLARRHPELAKGFAIGNSVAAGAFTAAAIHNWRGQ